MNFYSSLCNKEQLALPRITIDWCNFKQCQNVAATQSKMDGRCSKHKEVTEHSLLKDETKNFIRRKIPIKNYKIIVWERRTEQFWASLPRYLGTLALIQAPATFQRFWELHQFASFVHVVFSPANVSGFRKQATISKKLSIKTSLLVPYINITNYFLVTAQ